VFPRDGLLARQVGDGPGHLQDPVGGAGTQAETFDGGLEEYATGTIEAEPLVEVGANSFGRRKIAGLGPDGRVAFSGRPQPGPAPFPTARPGPGFPNRYRGAGELSPGGRNEPRGERKCEVASPSFFGLGYRRTGGLSGGALSVFRRKASATFISGGLQVRALPSAPTVCAYPKTA